MELTERDRRSVLIAVDNGLGVVRHFRILQFDDGKKFEVSCIDRGEQAGISVWSTFREAWDVAYGAVTNHLKRL